MVRPAAPRRTVHRDSVKGQFAREIVAAPTEHVHPQVCQNVAGAPTAGEGGPGNGRGGGTMLQNGTPTGT